MGRARKKHEDSGSTRPKLTVFKPQAPRAPGPTCIDLFAGAGGLAEGFRQAGWSIIAANDQDDAASKTFRLNFPEALFFHGSVLHLRASRVLRATALKRGELDCLIGGPPCQSFSYNNHNRTASDLRAHLFRGYLALVRGLLPKTLVMENVPGMLTIGDGQVTREIARELQKLGYSTTTKILYAEDYGVPQERRRAFIFASRISEALTLVPKGTHGPSPKPALESNPYVHHWVIDPNHLPQALTTVWDAISDLRKPSKASTPSDYNLPPQTNYQRYIRNSSSKVTSHVATPFSALMLRRIKYVPEGGNWRQIPRRLLPAGMRRAELTDHTKRYGRLKRQGLASTILTKCDPHWGAYVHPTQDRRITVREAARLQSFPDSFLFSGKASSRHYEQVGNAVPVLVAKAIAQQARASVENHYEAARGAKQRAA